MAKSLPKWVKEVLQKREAIEQILGLPIGEALGCGHFGCVFASTSPWVVKLTRDPTEGAMWARLGEWVRETTERNGGLGTDGMARVKEVVRIQPDLKFGRRTWPIHAIVREEVQPLATQVSYAARLTDYSLRMLGIEHWEGAPPEVFHLELAASRRALTGGSSVEVGNLKELHSLIRGLQSFRESAEKWHRENARKRDRSQARLEQLRDELVNATNRMHGWIGNAIGETLNELLSNDIVLKDVHVYNIGWRVHESIGGDEAPETLVIFDPGHTPTTSEVEIREMTPNPMFSRRAPP